MNTINQPKPGSDKQHQDSKANYPLLNLSAGEYVILDIKRHPIGLVVPVLVGAVLAAVFIAILAFYPVANATSGLPSFGLIALIIGLLLILDGLGTLIAIWVYLQNQFFLTNESVIQEIQLSLFSLNEQTASLGSIEDASFKRTGFVQTLFDYGSIRLSTEGDETTYRFPYVANPKKQIAIVNNAIEAFKNGRPYEPVDDLN